MQQNLIYIHIEPKRPPTYLAEEWESAPAESFFWYAVNLVDDFLFPWKKKQTIKKANRETEVNNNKLKEKTKKQKTPVTRFFVTPLRSYPLRHYAFY